MKKIACLLIFVISLTLFHGVSFAEPAAKLYKYTAVDLGIAKRHDIDECRIHQIVGDEVFFWTVKPGEERDFEKLEFFLIDIADDYKETKIPFTLEDIFVTDVYYSGEYIYILYHNRDDEQCILQIDKKGNTLADFKLQGIERGQTVYRIYTKDDGRIFASGRMGAAGFDMEGNMIWQVERHSGFFASSYDGDDRLYCEDVNAKYEIDVNEGKLVSIKTGNELLYAEVYGSCGEAYLHCYDGIKKLDGDWDNLKTVIDFWDYRIEGSMEAFYADGDKLRFIDHDPFDKDTGVLLHTIDFKEKGEPRKEVLLMFPEYMPFPGEMFTLIHSYNRFSTDCYVSYSYYKPGEEMGSFYGDVSPDIVLMTEPEIRSHMDMVVDIMPYMKRAEKLTPDSLLPAVKRNYTENGAFYMLPIELTLDTYVLRESDYDKASFSNTDYFDYIKRDGALYTDYFLSKESVMQAVMETGLRDFVDYGKKTCSFNSSAFKKLVTQIDGLGSENYFYIEAELAPVGEGDRILDEARITDLDFFSKKRTAYGEEVIAAGKPSKTKGLSIMSAMCMAVTKDCAYPEGAFDFMEYYSTHFTGSDRESMLLANKEQFNKSLDLIKERGTFVNSFGKTVLISQDDIEAICEAIDNSVARYSKDAKVMEYVTYYTDKYFDGEMTLDEAVNELQKTVKEYLNK